MTTSKNPKRQRFTPSKKTLLRELLSFKADAVTLDRKAAFQPTFTRDDIHTSVLPCCTVFFRHAHHQISGKLPKYPLPPTAPLIR